MTAALWIALVSAAFTSGTVVAVVRLRRDAASGWATNNRELRMDVDDLYTKLRAERAEFEDELRVQRDRRSILEDRVKELEHDLESKGALIAEAFEIIGMLLTMMDEAGVDTSKLNGRMKKWMPL